MTNFLKRRGSPGWLGGIKMQNIEILPDFDFVAVMGISVSQTYVFCLLVLGPTNSQGLSGLMSDMMK